MIANKDGVGLTMNELDQEVCALWGIAVKSKAYAKPGEQDDDMWNFNPNWFDSVGFTIHSLGRKDESHLKVDWSEVLGLLLSDLLMDKINDFDALRGSIEGHWKPYIDLIKHWSDKGYKAIAVYR